MTNNYKQQVKFFSVTESSRRNVRDSENEINKFLGTLDYNDLIDIKVIYREDGHNDGIAQVMVVYRVER